MNEEEKSPLVGLVDVDSPVFEAASLTDKVMYATPNGNEYSTPAAADKACPGAPLEIVHNIQPFRHAVSILHNRLLVMQRRFEPPLRVLVSNGDSNYRYGVARDYKGNRAPGKPWWIGELQKWLVEGPWKAERSPPYMETDDVLAVEQTENTCIISQDKDLDTVPGWHFNYKKPEAGLYYVSPLDAWRFFCVQMLAGDGADNIKGLPNCTPELRTQYKLSAQSLKGCGMGSAKKILEGAETEEELTRRVIEAYNEVYKDSSRAFIELTRAAQLLRMGWN